MIPRFKIDYWLLAPVIILIVISITVLFSLDSAYAKSQLTSVIVAAITFLFFSQINVNFLRQLKTPIYIFSIIILFIISIITSC
jgi:cell division protein FtsW (lipid II flippase)